MYKTEPAEFWWGHLAGPQNAVDETCKALVSGKAPLLKFPEDIPWVSAMRSNVENEFKQQTNLTDVVFDYVDLAGADMAPGEFLQKRYAPGDHGFRAGAKNTLQKYFAKRGYLKNRVVWLSGAPAHRVREWINFVKQYDTDGVEQGLFVLEIGGAKEETGRNAIIVDFAEHIHNHDLQVFCSFLMSEKRQYSDLWQEYISVLVSQTCGIDAELASLVIRSTDLRFRSMGDALRELKEKQSLDTPRDEQIRARMDSLLEADGFDSLRRREWTTQIQVLFPVIEMERVAFIERWRDCVQTALDKHVVESFGTRLTRADDVELGTLSWMMCQRDNDGLYKMYIPDEDARQDIRFLHECRNNLAHMGACTPDQIDELFFMSERDAV